MTPVADDDLGMHLTDLGNALSSDADLTAGVRARLDAPVNAHSPRRLMVLRAATITILVTIGAILAIPPARSTAAEWLGIGRTQIEVVDELPPTVPPTNPPATPSTSPTTSGEIEVGALVLTSRPIGDDTIVYRKVLTPDVGFEYVDLADGIVAIWIDGDHALIRGTDPAESAGPVLVWPDGDVEFRLSGAESLGEALEFARSLAREN